MIFSNHKQLIYLPFVILTVKIAQFKISHWTCNTNFILFESYIKIFNNYLKIKFNRLEIYWGLRKKGKRQIFSRKQTYSVLLIYFLVLVANYRPCVNHILALLVFCSLKVLIIFYLKCKFFHQKKTELWNWKNTSFWKVVMYE